MRIIIDMQGAQTSSRFRGIGRVTRNLTESIIYYGKHDVHLAFNGLLPKSAEDLRERYGSLLPKGNMHVWLTASPLNLAPGDRQLYRQWASTIYSEFLVSLRPDVVFIPSLMEYNEDNFFCDPIPLKGKSLLASVVHDFIPLREGGKALTFMQKSRYDELLRRLRKMDAVFPISGFTRDECAIYLPGIRAREIPLAADDFFCPGKVDEDGRRRLREAFGINRPFILYCGGLDERKNVPFLMHAYAKLSPEIRRQYQLVLACGSQSHLFEKLAQYGKELGLSREDARLLGYVDDEELRDLYRSCALFVFPSRDEGFGLPVLEAARCGAVVICSNAAAVPEILDAPDALFDPEDADALCRKMSRALADADFRRSLALRAMERSSLFTWERAAELVMTTIEEFAGKPAVCWPEENFMTRLERILGQLAAPAGTDKELALLADALARTFPRPRQPQLLIDIGLLAKIDSKTGIQRAVKGISMELSQNPPKGWLVRFVHPAEDKGYYAYAHEAALRLFGYNDGLKQDMPIEYAEEDIFLGLDLVLEQTVSHINELRFMRACGVKIYFIVYDIIPLLFPEYAGKGMTSHFAEWLRAISKFDGLVCISQAVAGEVRGWLKNHGLSRANLKISSFSLGADIGRCQPTWGIPADGLSTLKKLRERPTILMVGTIEPRKGHKQTLAAMELLWSRGMDVNLALAGKSGWKMDDFEARLRRHPENGERLFWLRGISDEYLEQVYKASAGVLLASEAEGFGLSIIEAARCGKPLILRDIPVFREIAANNAFYFAGLETEDLADALSQWFEAFARDDIPLSTDIRWLTWQESRQSLLTLIGIRESDA